MEKTIYQQAIEKFGVEKQTDMLIEEMAELTQALLKYRRNPTKENLDNLHEEFVDVEIVASQINCLLNTQELNEWRFVKLARLEILIKKP